MDFNQLIENVIEWADNKGLLKKYNSTKQMLKVIEEVGETAGALAKNNEDDLKDGIGDVFVTLIILSKQCGFEPDECLEAARDRDWETNFLNNL